MLIVNREQKWFVTAIGGKQVLAMLVAHLWHKWTWEEISQSFGVPQRTARRHVARAIAMLEDAGDTLEQIFASADKPDKPQEDERVDSGLETAYRECVGTTPARYRVSGGEFAAA